MPKLVSAPASSCAPALAPSAWRPRKAGCGWLLGLCMLLLLVPPSVLAEAPGFGPFPVRNFQPIQVLFLGMYGDRAAVVPKGVVDVQVELAETASVFDELSGTNRAQIKSETLRSAILLRYGVTDRLEVSLEIPTLYRSRGFLDGTIKQTERLTTGLSGPRQRLDGIGYIFDVTQSGRTLFSGDEDQLGLGDVSLLAKWQVSHDAGSLPASAVRLGVKVPSGDDDRIFGSGHADVGVGLALEKRLGSRWMVYANANGVFPTGEVAGLELDPILSAIAALEFLWTPSFSLGVQFDYYSTPFDGTGLKLLDRGVTEVTVGFNYQVFPNVLWRVYGVENVDFTTESSADFTLATLVSVRFNP